MLGDCRLSKNLSMGRVRKIGNEYYIEFEARGLKYQQKAGRNQKDAQKFLKEIETKIRQGEMGILVRDVDLDIFLKDFSTYAKLNHTFKTQKRFQRLLKNFSGFLNKEAPHLKKLSEMTPQIIERYKIHLLKLKRNRASMVKLKVINLSLILLREIMDYGIKLGYLNDNPTLHIKFVAGFSHWKPRILTPKEREKLIRGSQGLLKQVLEVMLETGLGLQEIIDLRWEDVDLEHSNIFVMGREKKGVPPEYCKLHIKERVQGLLRSWKSSSLIFRNNVFLYANKKLGRDFLIAQFQQLIRSIGLEPPVSWGSLRHTFAYDLLKKRLPLTKVYLYLGLTDIGKAMIYTSFLLESNREIYSEVWGLS